MTPRPIAPRHDPRHAPAAPRCRWCERALGALQARRGLDAAGRGLCDAAACRWRESEAGATRRRDAALAQAAGAARVAASHVAWLRRHDDRLAPVADADRAALAAHIEAAARAPDAHPRDPALAGFDEADDALPAVDAALCGACRGRCCRHGGGRRAFIDGPLLAREAQRHGGDAAAAAAAYIARIPGRHVTGSCLYHGEQGCVLPRAMRAPVCNGWACDTLHGARAAAGTGRPLLAAWPLDDGRVEARALDLPVRPPTGPA